MATTETLVPDLVVALLAAGRSSRFGAADKRMALLGERPLIAWAAEAGRSVVAVRHVLVTSGATPFDAAAPGYEALVNGDAAEGLASSLRLAARVAREADAAGLLVLLADMPFVDTAHLARLVSAFGHEPGRPVFSRAPGSMAQPPALFPAAYFPELERLSGDKGARQFARDAVIIETNAEMLIDVDTPEDLERARQMHEARMR